MHSVLFASQSPVLDALVNNGMKQTTEQSVTWDHISEHTFSKFCQFAYTGSFAIEAPGTTIDNKDMTRSEWLIQYAEVINFAECYAIDSLLATSAEKLETVLASLSVTGKAAPAMADFLKHCFLNENPAILRDIVKACLEMNGSEFWRNSYFQGVVKDVGVLSHVLIDCLASRNAPVTARCTKASCRKLWPGFMVSCCGVKCELVYSAEGLISKMK
jgi:hypothetical protein